MTQASLFLRHHSRKLVLPLLIATTICAVTPSTPALAQATVINERSGPVNVLVDGGFKNLNDNVLADWQAFGGGYSIAAGGGRNGANAVVMERRADDPARGASQVIVLEQSAPSPVTVSGWSRAENVSGVADVDYSLFADILYVDGSTQWGANAPFAVGTHDWQQQTFTITPDKPIKSLTVYALFRKHTGKAWFSGMQVTARPRPVAIVPLADLEAVKNYAARPYIATPDAGAAIMPAATAGLLNQLKNTGFEEAENGFPRNWAKWGSGGRLAPGEGRDGSAAFVSERSASSDPELGVQQSITLNQTKPEPVVAEGWSRAENVNGTRDRDYSLYCDVAYTDGTSLWGVTQGFGVGTHDWQRAQIIVVPQKPIKSLTIYGLFRGHTGKVWFDDFRASTRGPEANTAFFDGVPVQLPSQKNALTKTATGNIATRDGLTLQLDQKSGGIASLRVSERELATDTPGGFLVRDVANNSGYYPVRNGECAPLKLKVASSVQAQNNHIVISGHVEDTTRLDRAVSMVFALPLDARGWTWDNDVRSSQSIATGGEYSNTQPINSGSNGGQSIYPVANIRDANTGLALALDMNFPAQYRLGYNADTRQLFIVYDFGFTPEKPRADFRFVLYRTDPQWGFRAATQKLYGIFPSYFVLPEGAKKQGLWMPFNDIRPIENPQDFGFRFREAGDSALQNGSAAWDDANDVLTLLYSEPMTYWMSMPLDMPRTYEAAVNELRRIAADAKHPQYTMARAVVSSGIRDEEGRLAARFENQPWGNGAVWSISPSPGLNDTKSTPDAKTGGTPTGASLVWNAQKLERLKNPTGVRPDGEYLDSLEGYVTVDLNFARDQFAASSVPLTFSSSSFVPAQHKGLLVTEMTRWMSREVRAAGGLMMANSVPYRFGFAAPWLDIMGTETNWNHGGKFSPDSDSSMNLRRTLSGPKPYLLLQNTDFRNFSNAIVQRYMERCLFYGVFPSFFSANAATDVYWSNPKLYNRDRDLFKKYVPVVRAVAEAGWQPVTHATSANPAIWLERFGEANAVYLTLRNNADTPQSAHIALAEGLRAGPNVKEVLNNTPINVEKGVVSVNLQPDQTLVLRLR